MMNSRLSSDERVLVLMPTTRDTQRVCETLAAAALPGVPCPDAETVCREFAAGAGVLLLAEQAIRSADSAILSQALDDQPTWSDIPVVVLLPKGPDEGTVFADSINAMLLDETVGDRVLLSAVRSGLRARRRQFQARDQLAQRQETEEALLAERERLRITLASIGDGVICTDAEGRVTFLNGVAEALTGWPLAQATGQSLPEVFRIVNEQSRRPVANPALRALEEGVIVGLANHTLLIARDGTERPIDDSAAPICDSFGAMLGAVLVFRDVTERKQAEETRARLAAIVESSDDAIVSKTLDGTIRSWNAGAERLFGHSAAETIGKSITLIIPPDRLDEERQILARLRRGERIDHFETVRMAKNGRLIDISLTVSPVRDAEGHIVGASKIGRDITERKRAERALREADRRKDEFIALLAHELRNPLAPIRNGLQVMRLGSEDADAIAQVQAMMERQLTHMVRIVDDLLDISRISRGKMELRRSRLSLADIVASAVETARPVIEAGGHELLLSLPPTPVFLDADLTRLAQVLGNLLSNSARYTPAGGHIWLEAREQEGQAVISVRDDGIGIPEKALKTIFEMFAQVDRSLERGSEGLGIGLALVKALVELHGGTVTAESPGPGQGSTVTVRLPVLREASASGASPMASSTPSKAGHERRLLVVDDNRDAATSMAMMLRLVGYDVRTASDGLKAVATAESFQPQVILMDLGMPNLSGYEATRRIREQPDGQAVTIIALTGWGQESDRIRSREAGCDGHLVKPVALADLEKLLSDLADDQETLE